MLNAVRLPTDFDTSDKPPRLRAWAKQYKMAEYMLQAKQPYPPAILKQIRPEQLTKNNTNQPERWKDIAFSEDLEALKTMLTPNRRIVNWGNLEVVCRGK